MRASGGESDAGHATARANQRIFGAVLTYSLRSTGTAAAKRHNASRASNPLGLGSRCGGTGRAGAQPVHITGHCTGQPCSFARLTRQGNPAQLPLCLSPLSACTDQGPPSANPGPFEVRLAPAGPSPLGIQPGAGARFDQASAERRRHDARGFAAPRHHQAQRQAEHYELVMPVFVGHGLRCSQFVLWSMPYRPSPKTE